MIFFAVLSQEHQHGGVRTPTAWPPRRVLGDYTQADCRRKDNRSSVLVPSREQLVLQLI